MSQNSTGQLVKEALSKQQTFLGPKLSAAIDEKTKEVLKSLGFKDIDPVKVDHLANDIAQTASLDVMDNIGRIQDISQSSSVIADSITQSLLAHPLTHAQAIQMNEADIYRKTEKQIGGLLTKFQIQSDLEKVAVLSNLDNLADLEKPNTELKTQISNEVDRHVQEKSPLAHPSVNNTLKENALEMTNTYTENLNGKTKILLEKGAIPTLAELNNLKTETFNDAATKISINTATFKDKVEPAALAERLSYVLDLKPLDQNQTETLGLGNAEPGILTFTKGTGAAGFTVGFGISNNQAAQEGAYNSLLIYDKDWLEKTSSQQVKIIEETKEKATASPREIIKANYAQKKLQVLQNARAYQAQNPKLVEAYQEYFQSRPIGSRLIVSSQAAQTTTNAHFNTYRGTYSPRSLSTNTGYLAQKTFGGMAFKFGGSKIGSLSKTMKLGKGLASKASVPLMIKSATQKLMKKMAKITGLGFAATALYFMHLGAAALKGFIIGAAIGGTVGAGAGAALGLAIAAPFGPFAPLVAVVTVPLGAVIGGFVGATIGGVTGGLIAYGLASGSTTAISMGVGTGIGGTIGAYVGFTIGTAVAGAFVTFAAAACAATLIGCVLVPVAFVASPVIIFTSTVVFTYIGAAIGAGIGYVVGEYVLEPARDFIGAAGHSITGGGSLLGGAASSFGSFVAGAASSLWGGISGLASSLASGAGNFFGSIWGGITNFSLSSTAVAAPIITGVGTVATFGIVSGIVTSTSFFNNSADIASQVIPPNSTISVTKTANPSRIDNSALPVDIQFRVTIQAKSVALTNITCSDVTTKTKSGGTTPVTTTFNPSLCPASLAANEEKIINYSAHADNSFTDSTVNNIFTINYDTGALALGSCGSGSGFSSLLPTPIPPSVGAASPAILSRLLSGQVIPAARAAATQTGVACELLIGIHYVEASWWDDGSFVSGRTIGQIEPDISIPSDCTSAGGIWTVGIGCNFTTLEQSAIYAGNLISQKKMPYLFGVSRPPTNFVEMVGVMSSYNGGGNSNCGEAVPYTGTCPPLFYGEDDPYALHHFDTQHTNMYLIFCADFTRCSPPQLFSRDGAATAAKEYYKSAGGT